MTKYEFYSTIFECTFQVKYNNGGVMVGFEMFKDDAIVMEKLALILTKCLNEKPFLEYMKEKKIPVTRIIDDISFDAFWNAYNYKEGGSKKKAEAAYNKLSDADKSAAINYIPKYRRIKAKETTALAYATTYLNGQLWNN